MGPFKKFSVKKLCLWGCLTGVIVIVLGLGYCYLSYHAKIGNIHYSQGQNALWARHQWVGTPMLLKNTSN